MAQGFGLIGRLPTTFTALGYPNYRRWFIVIFQSQVRQPEG